MSSTLTKSIQNELNSFFSKLSDKDYNILSVTKGALTQARAKLKHSAFIELSNHSIAEFYKNESIRLWNGFRLIAVDGSSSNLPSHPSIIETFGSFLTGCKKTVESSMARVSMIYDVLNCITIDAEIESQKFSECALLKKQLNKNLLQKGDLFLADRGYPSNALMYELTKTGIEFCFRMRSHWKEVTSFVNSGEKSRIVNLELDRKDKQLLTKYNTSNKQITCRLIAIELESGEIEVLCTSLIDEKKYKVEDLKELYHLRWGIEEAYKLLKVRMELSNYSGKTAESVKQDFFAKIFMMNMCAIMSFPIEEKIRKENREKIKKHNQQINKTSVIANLKGSWFAIWLQNKTVEIIESLDAIFYKTKEIIRPNRKFERKKYRYPDKKPSPPYKRI